MTSRITILAASAAISLVWAAVPAVAQVPKEQLLVPPADSQKFKIVSAAGEHGSAAVWRLADGSFAFRESMNLFFFFV